MPAHEDRRTAIIWLPVIALAMAGLGALFAAAAQERDGIIPREAVEAERAFLGTKLAGLFQISPEIAEDLERQEEEMRARAQQLRDAADSF